MFPFESKYVYLLLSLLLIWWLFEVFRVSLKKGLYRVPGPLVAKFSNLWRVKFVWSGDAHEQYRVLHEKYGPIVRTAPEVVDIADPSVIQTIYGINSKFLKVAAVH